MPPRCSCISPCHLPQWRPRNCGDQDIWIILWRGKQRHPLVLAYTASQHNIVTAIFQGLEFMCAYMCICMYMCVFVCNVDHGYNVKSKENQLVLTLAICHRGALSRRPGLFSVSSLTKGSLGGLLMVAMVIQPTTLLLGRAWHTLPGTSHICLLLLGCWEVEHTELPQVPFSFPPSELLFLNSYLGYSQKPEAWGYPLDILQPRVDDWLSRVNIWGLLLQDWSGEILSLLGRRV